MSESRPLILFSFSERIGLRVKKCNIVLKIEYVFWDDVMSIHSTYIIQTFLYIVRLCVFLAVLQVGEHVKITRSFSNNGDTTWSIVYWEEFLEQIIVNVCYVNKRETFMKLGTPSPSRQFTYWFILLITNSDKSSSNSDIHSFNTRNRTNVQENFKFVSVAQKGIECTEISVFKNLPYYSSLVEKQA